MELIAVEKQPDPKENDENVPLDNNDGDKEINLVVNENRNENIPPRPQIHINMEEHIEEDETPMNSVVVNRFSYRDYEGVSVEVTLVCDRHNKCRSRRSEDERKKRAERDRKKRSETTKEERKKQAERDRKRHSKTTEERRKEKEDKSGADEKQRKKNPEDLSKRTEKKHGEHKRKHGNDTTDEQRKKREDFKSEHHADTEEKRKERTEYERKKKADHKHKYYTNMKKE